jgi:hypothetical protein
MAFGFLYYILARRLYIMKIFFPIFHPIFRFPSVHPSEKRSIKFIKNKKLNDEVKKKDEQVTDELQLRTAEHTFGGVDPRVAWWFFYKSK